MNLNDIQNLKYNDYIIKRKISTYKKFIDLQYPENMYIYRFIIDRKDKKTILLENVTDTSLKNLVEVPYKDFLEDYCLYEDVLYDYNYFIDEADITLDFLKSLNMLISQSTHTYMARTRLDLLDEIKLVSKYHYKDYDILKYIGQLEKGIRRCSKRLYKLDKFIKEADINIEEHFENNLILHGDYFYRYLSDTKNRVIDNFKKLKNDYENLLNEK